MAIPNGKKCPFGCSGYVTVVVVSQRQQIYSGARMYTWFYLSSMNVKFVLKGSILNLPH
jgi:hypothetical protein